LLFRWFVGLNMDHATWDAIMFTKPSVCSAAFVSALKQARQRDLLSDEHFTVDATLLEP
jgi:hypothetical protein